MKCSSALLLGAQLPIFRAFAHLSSDDDGPIQIVDDSSSSSLDFNGDNIHRPHDLLWNIDGYLAKKGGVPAPDERRRVVVVGGGMSGLLSSYLLSSEKFSGAAAVRDLVLLEQDNYFGGNSKGELYSSNVYSIGAAYIVKPAAGSDSEKIFADLDLTQYFRAESSHDSKVDFQKQLLTDFWNGQSDPSRSQEFKLVFNELSNIYKNAFPDVPWNPQSQLSKEELFSLDSISFRNWLDQKFPNLHPHILEYFQLYCWSSFAGSLTEISAAQALNFLAAETDTIWALPGGNAQIAHALYARLFRTLGRNSIRSQAMVLRVEAKGPKETWVTYEDGKGQLHTIACENCIVACQKMVAKLIVKDIPAPQLEIMDNIDYRAYIVANAIYAGPITSPAFDIYSLKGEMPKDPTALHPPDRSISDVCFANWAIGDKSTHGILTIYRPLPYGGARQFLFSPNSHEKHKNQINADLQQFASDCNLDFNKFIGIRMTRWGHALPLAEFGRMAQSRLELMNRPIKECIFFANQDNWLNPSFECALSAASEAAKSCIHGPAIAM